MQLTAKKCTKKRDANCKVVVLPCEAIAYLTLSSPPLLKLPIIYDTLWSVKNRIFSEQIELLLVIASQTFFRPIGIVPSFLVRKEENKSFPCTHKLGERTGRVWRKNSRRVWTHEKNSGETVRRLGTIKAYKAFFVPNQEPASAWIFGNSSVRVGNQGLFRRYLKLSFRLFSRPDWLPLGFREWVTRLLINKCCSCLCLTKLKLVEQNRSHLYYCHNPVERHAPTTSKRLLCRLVTWYTNQHLSNKSFNLFW